VRTVRPKTWPITRVTRYPVRFSVVAMITDGLLLQPGAYAPICGGLQPAASALGSRARPVRVA
jgi:hypothetical protein